jgi:hypothetical protein
VRHLLGADDAARPGFVLDHERLAERRRQLVGNPRVRPYRIRRPAGLGTMMRTARAGQVCAAASRVATRISAAAAARAKRRMGGSRDYRKALNRKTGSE